MNSGGGEQNTQPIWHWLIIATVTLLMIGAVEAASYAIVGSPWRNAGEQSFAEVTAAMREVAFRGIDDACTTQSTMLPFFPTTESWKYTPSQPVDSNYFPDGFWRFGFRHPSPAHEALIGDFKVFVFGGSTVFGDGIRCDKNLIPAFLEKELRKRMGRDVRVYNLGQSAYNSRNEMSLLVALLERGFRPDLVIFYDGGNDARRVMSGVPHFRYENFVVASTGQFTLRHALKSALLYRSAFARLVTGEQSLVGAKIAEGADGRPVLTSSTGDIDEPHHIVRRARETAEDMLREYEFGSALGKTFGFRFIAALQPAIFGGKPLSSDESTMLTQFRREAPALEQSYSALYGELKKSDRMTDVSDYFGQITDTVYFDYIHVSPTGTRAAARCLADTVMNVQPPDRSVGGNF